MILNPFFLLLLIYLIANTFAFFKLINLGGFNVFGYFWSVPIEISIISYMLQILFLLIIYVFYKLNFTRNYKVFYVTPVWGYILLFITTSFFIFNQITGAGKAGSGFSFEGNNLLNIIFVLLQPDLLFLLLTPFIKSKRLFWILVIINFLSLISRGWMGSVLLILIVYLIREYPVKMNFRNTILFILVFLLIFFSLPLLDALKWGFRLNLTLDEIILDLLEVNYFETLYIVLESVISRFQNLYYVAYIFQNKQFYFESLLSGQMSWFYQNGIINSIYCKFATCSMDINLYVASNMVNDYTITWNIDSGSSGWVSVLNIYSVYFFIFTFFLFLFSFRLYKKMYDSKGVILFGIFCLIYFFHGWLGAFYNVIIYGFILSIFFRIKLRKKNETK